jgi:hypothetical protein
LTAPAEGKPAFEGNEGHGVFTWALLDALKKVSGDFPGSPINLEHIFEIEDGRIVSLEIRP